jgi:glycosyltransferase involved in cell wall biosynthesis
LPECYPGIAGRVQALGSPTDFTALDRLAAEAPLRRAAEAPTILWMGRLTGQKRPDLALEALARVRRHLDARLWLCGAGRLGGAVERRIADLGLSGAAESLGFVDNPYSLIRQADLFLLTSDFEGLPNALIEAQGLGLPAVATRCPYGPDEIVEDGVTGRLVPPGDPEGLAAAILELLRDPGRRRRMGEAAARRVRQLFDRERLLEEWEALLEQVVAARRR